MTPTLTSLLRRTLVAAMIVVTAGSAFAFDWGGYVDNTTGIAKPPLGVDSSVQLIQSTTVALWAQQKLGGWNLDTQGSYTFTPNTPLLFDLDRLTLGTDVIATEAGATTVGVTVGRTNFTDATGFVLNHTLDGIKLQVNRQRSSFRTSIGTTALLQKPTNSIVLGTLDALDLSDDEKLFAPPRIIANFEYRVLEIFAAQHASFAATVQEDLRPADELTGVGTEVADPVAGGHVDTQYVSLGLSGPLAPGLFHRTYATLNTGRRLEYVSDTSSGTGSSYQYESLLAMMAGAELTWFLPEVLNSRARFFGMYSTGASETSETFNRFVPLSPGSYSDVFTLQPGNSAHLGLSYSMRPLAALGSDVLQTELRSVSYFRSAGSGGVSESAVNAASDGSYVGTDVNLVLTVVPFSDLRLVLKSGIFAPNSAVMTPENENVDYQVTLQGVLRF